MCAGPAVPKSRTKRGGYVVSVPTVPDQTEGGRDAKNVWHVSRPVEFLTLRQASLGKENEM